MARRSIVLPLAALVLAGGAWCAYWFVGARIVENGVANWMAREADHGRNWTCRDQSVGGFPLNFELRCASVVVDASGAREPFRAEAGALRAFAPAWRFNHVITDISGPLKATFATGETVDATWGQMRAGVIVSGGRLESYDGTARGLNAVLRIGAESRPIIAAELLEARLAPSTTAADAAFDIALDGRRIKSPLLDSSLGGTDPGDVTLRATVTRADMIGAGTPLDNVERWRAAGGKATIAQLQVARGRVALNATGELQLDEARQIAGRLQGSAAGLEQLLARGGGVLGGLINLRTQPSAGLPFALTMKDGRVMMGPIRLGTMAPLY